jgi:hypothetical protein
VLNGWAHRENFGYRVVERVEGGPTHLAGIDNFLDFIVYQPNAEHQLLFSEYIMQNAGKTIALRVYNLIQRGTREVEVTLPLLKDANL